MFKVLELNWNQLMSSEYIYKSNHVLKVAEFNSECFHEDETHQQETFSNKSIVVIYYDAFKGVPLVLCERVPGIISKEDIDLTRCADRDDFVAFIDYPVDENCTDIILTRRSIVDAIESNS